MVSKGPTHEKRTAAQFMTRARRSWWMPFIVALVGVLLYANTLQHGYVLDDVGVISENANVQQGLRGIPAIFGTEYWHFQNAGFGYYRPLSLASFAAEHQFFPGNPHVGHAVNVLCYAIIGFFLCHLLFLLFPDAPAPVPLAIALLFIAHPLHTEVVANIKSRDELFAFLGTVIACWSVLKAASGERTHKGWMAFACIAAYLAMLAKESAFVIPLLAAVMLHFVRGMQFLPSIRSVLPLALMVPLFLLQKWWVLGSLTVAVSKDIVIFPYAGSGALNVLVVLAHCVRLTVFPHPLSFDYSYKQIPSGGATPFIFVFGAFAAMVLLLIIVLGWKKRNVFAHGVALYIITLAPALGFVFLRGGILAERFLFAPVLGFSTVLVHFFLYFARNRWKHLDPGMLLTRRAGVPLALVFLLFSAGTVMRNPVWHDNFRLFSTDVRTASRSCKIHCLLGYTLIDQAVAEKDSATRESRFSEGVAELREALRIHPLYADPNFKLAYGYYAVRGDAVSAIHYYSIALKRAPASEIVYNNMGRIYEDMGREDFASYCYNMATALNPRFDLARKNSDAHEQRTGLDLHSMPVETDLDSLEHATPVTGRDAHYYYDLGNPLAYVLAKRKRHF